MTDTTTDYIDPTENPELANATIASVLSDDPVDQEPPSIGPPRDGLVRLPGGLLMADGSVRHDAEVQELTGAHEERLVKIRNSGDAARFVHALLTCGVVTVGGETVTDEILDELLVGDREYLVLAIREATYGPEIEMDNSTVCAFCNEVFDLVLQTNDIQIRTLSGERQFEVPLRKGGRALVRLPNGGDQEAYLEDQSLTDPERNSILLSRCVVSLTDADGEVHSVAGFPSLVRDGLGIRDRQAILKAINERQPGPRYDEVEYTHECGGKSKAFVGLVHLFPGL